MKDRSISTKSALNSQVGGDHYSNFNIQPAEFITKNKLKFLQGSIIKRMCRYDQEGGGGLQDLLKAKHEIDLLIELDNWEIKL